MSGTWARSIGMTGGPPSSQCAHTVARMTTQGTKPLQQFYARVLRRRGKKIAIVALARKLLTTAYGMLKRGQPYDPRKLQAAWGNARPRARTNVARLLGYTQTVSPPAP